MRHDSEPIPAASILIPPPAAESFVAFDTVPEDIHECLALYQAKNVAEGARGADEADAVQDRAA